MLLFSTILDIRENVTKEDFIRLVIEWNDTNPRPVNVIPGVVWNGEANIRYGTQDLWMEILEYPARGIVAVRYEKVEEDGIVWDTDYVFHLAERKLSIQLDRSYKEEALRFNPEFSTPHFISLLISHQFLKDDEMLPVLRTPISLNADNAALLADTINGKNAFSLPVVYVSKTNENEDPVDVAALAGRLKGAAHVLVEEDISMDAAIREACESCNEYNGAIGVYYPNITIGRKRLMYHGREAGKTLLENVIRTTVQYINSQQLRSIYTWSGVNSAILNDQLEGQIEKRIAAEQARTQAEKARAFAEHEKARAEEETSEVYDSFDEDLKKLQRQVAELTKSNEALKYENYGLRGKLESAEFVPLLRMGEEEDLYEGEIKDLVLCSLTEYLEKNKPEGKHYKLTYYEDDRYWATMAKTPSDARNGKNLASQIAGEMF